MVDQGSLLNIMSLSMLEAMGISLERIIKQLIEVSSFGGSASFTIGYINLDLTIRLMRAATGFHVIDTPTSYHLLLGRPLIHKQLSHLRTNNAWKPSGKEWKFMSVPLSVHIPETAFFNELAKDRETVLARRQGVSLSALEDLKEQKSK